MMDFQDRVHVSPRKYAIERIGFDWRLVLFMHDVHLSGEWLVADMYELSGEFWDRERIARVGQRWVDNHELFAADVM